MIWILPGLPVPRGLSGRGWLAGPAIMARWGAFIVAIAATIRAMILSPFISPMP